jgi:hypothetical protein
LYYFGFDIILFQSSVKIRLVRNGIQVREKQAQAKDSYKHASGTAIVSLQKEDKVCLQSMLNEADLGKGATEIVFFGYLLYEN